MASRRGANILDPNLLLSDAGRELFEACRNGDLCKVKKLVNTHNVNSKDTAGRKSSPLHFAAGTIGIDLGRSTSKKKECFCGRLI